MQHQARNTTLNDIDKKGNLISKYFTKPTEQLSKQ
jgi:hypothetical protein